MQGKPQAIEGYFYICKRVKVLVRRLHDLWEVIGRYVLVYEIQRAFSTKEALVARSRRCRFTATRKDSDRCGDVNFQAPLENRLLAP
jgi:hypothetical protein